MEETKGAMDSQILLRTGVAICIIASLVSFLISFIGGIFIFLVIVTAFYGISFFAVKQKPIGNLLRGYVPPRTKWCSKMEFDHILIPADVDESLERLYERVITEHINSWYSDLSHDEEFLQEMRHLFRETTTEILTRLTRIDITETILNDIIPVALQHLDGYLWAIKHCSMCEVDLLLRQQTGDTKSSCLHSTWLAFMGKDVHPALASREAENDYIENLSEKLLPIILKNKITKSRLASSITTAILTSTVLQPLFDLLCEPRNLNKLLLLWFGPEPVRKFDACPDPPVRLLLRFVHAHSQPKPSALHVDLSAILKDTSLLYPFLQYLKKNGGVNLLQFCLAVEDFNKKMMVVDLKEEDLVTLHKDAKQLYDTYIKLGANNFIKFDDDIIKDVGNIINQGHKSIQKLRTTPPLFRAYEQVYNNLEDNLCPQFHTSDEYLGLVLGPRLSECRPAVKLKDEENNSKSKKDSWLSVMNPFKKLNSSSESKSVFYCSDQDMDVSEYCSEDLGFPEGFKKSASASNLLEINSGLVKNQELSKSLDFLDTVASIRDIQKSKSCEILENHSGTEERRKSQTLPKLSPKNPKKYFKHISVGNHFGSKRFNIGRKMSSVIAWKPQRKSSTTVKGRLSKMKTEVMGSGPMEGSPEPDMDQAFDLSELEDSEDTANKGNEVRDLSAWRVNIPRLEPRNDPHSGKACFVFIIQVQRIDMASQTDGDDLEWSVNRQYHEFYSLQSALVQYHGVFEDAKLPPRSKLFGGKGLDVLQSKQEPFQDYLVKLLQKPNLKKSDLLYTFLTSKQEFNEASSTNMFKGVPKLTKEKGQFLQSFINTYVASTLSPPPKPGRMDWEEEMESLKKHPVYKDNFSDHGLFKTAALGPTQTCSIVGLYDSILYLGVRLFKLSEPWLKLLTGLRWIIADSLNHLVHYMLSSKLDDMINSGRVAHIVSVIEESIFDPPAPQMELAEIQQQTENTLQAFRTYLPQALRSVLGDKFNPSTKTLFNVLQEPLLNKQLAYTLLETLLVKIFPELRI
eukprot:GFUD01014541.1.p1 GENE.GFUD01014541.1~~GFUD01014541.1.p1  ORF type:complete len:1024 (+),score=205.10 GFUD01014541.1:100-3171(+)